MTPDTSIWLVLALAFVAANLPFINDRWMAVWPARVGAKTLWLRMGELLLWYVAVGAVGFAFEGHFGQVHYQGWEFYTITASMFLTFAFPGFVYQYMVRGR